MCCWISGYVGCEFFGVKGWKRFFWGDDCCSSSLQLGNRGHFVRSERRFHCKMKALIEIESRHFGETRKENIMHRHRANVKIHRTCYAQMKMPKSRELNQPPVCTAMHPLVSLARSLARSPSTLTRLTKCRMSQRYREVAQPQTLVTLDNRKHHRPIPNSPFPIHNATAHPWQPV